MALILDIQCYKDNCDKLVVKELSCVGFKNVGNRKIEEEAKTFTFKPPCAREKLMKNVQIMNSWVERNLHGIPWEAGELPYSQLNMIINQVLHNKICLFVKGEEKKRFFSSIVPKGVAVHEMSTMICPSLQKLASVQGHNCEFDSYHENVRRNEYSCALKNVQKLKRWYIEVFCKSQPSLERSIASFIDLQNQIEKMTIENISFLTKDFILQFAAGKIDDIWNEIPEELKKDEEMKMI